MDGFVQLKKTTYNETQTNVNHIQTLSKVTENTPLYNYLYMCNISSRFIKKMSITLICYNYLCENHKRHHNTELIE